mmetsp:Transcript_12638/g.50766  ORF Transcript_12638/g.50766 Transcript_12638/m.50766 type:complete len:272 (+) Transcript_12638:164-979(+)
MGASSRSPRRSLPARRSTCARPRRVLTTTTSSSTETARCFARSSCGSRRCKLISRTSARSSRGSAQRSRRSRSPSRCWRSSAPRRPSGSRPSSTCSGRASSSRSGRPSSRAGCASRASAMCCSIIELPHLHSPRSPPSSTASASRRRPTTSRRSAGSSRRSISPPARSSSCEKCRVLCVIPQAGGCLLLWTNTILRRYIDILHSQYGGSTMRRSSTGTSRSSQLAKLWPVSAWMTPQWQMTATVGSGLSTIQARRRRMRSRNAAFGSPAYG